MTAPPDVANRLPMKATQGMGGTNFWHYLQHLKDEPVAANLKIFSAIINLCRYLGKSEKSRGALMRL